jgi:hypothetical protein
LVRFSYGNNIEKSNFFEYTNKEKVLQNENIKCIIMTAITIPIHEKSWPRN